MKSLKIFGASALALGASLLASAPAMAQQVCDVAGLPSGSATGAPSLACGAGSNASGGFSTSVGQNSVASGQYATAVGNYARATGFDATAVGVGALATDFGTAYGFNSRSTAPATTAIGNNAQATADYATAVGYYATATGLRSTAIGEYSRATSNDSVAIGYHANTATFTNSVALGASTTVTANNQVNVGGRTIGGVAAGVAPTDAVNVAQLNAATAGIGSSLVGIEADIADLYADNRHQDRQIGKANEGVAMALAMESPNIPAGSHFALSGGIGGYQGKHSLATAVSAALGEKATVSAGLGYGLNSGEVGYRAGFQVAF